MLSDQYTHQLLEQLQAQFPAHPRFLVQAQALLESLTIRDDLSPACPAAAILPRSIQPVRAVRLTLSWMRDTGHVQVTPIHIINYVNLYPCSYELVFRPDADDDALLTRGLAALLENTLAGQYAACVLGAAVDLNALSDRESMELCRSLAAALRHLIDPAVLISCLGSLPPREQGYLSGLLQAAVGRPFSQAATALSPAQAVGYGLCFFVQAALQTCHSSSMNGKTILILGRGDTAVYAAQKATQLGGHVTAIGDDQGYLHGSRLTMSVIKTLLNRPMDDTMAEYCRKPDSIWDIPADVVLVCSHTASIDAPQARRLAAHGLMTVAEGISGMCSSQAQAIWENAGILFCPGAAAGAGGSLLAALKPHLSPWDADKQLRASVRALFQLLRDTYPENLTHAAHIAAAARWETALLTQGVI
jgi:glutamate dehydrogenase (NADP+)